VSAPFADLSRPIRLRPRATERRPALDARVPTDSEPISIDTRLFVWQRDGGKCRHCSSRENLHFDHVIPRSWGGSSTVENVQLLCRDCNLRKGASLVDGRGAIKATTTADRGEQDGEA
jgi:5-methylcytosine-specific restriction endonuclease McrA